MVQGFYFAKPLSAEECLVALQGQPKMPIRAPRGKGR
jgi:EAL domain-containing protein (putative c-di-GMP-specific phosphodiesterase class I)